MMSHFCWSLCPQEEQTFCCGEGQMYRTQVVELTMSCFFSLLPFEFSFMKCQVRNNPDYIIRAFVCVYVCLCKTNEVMSLPLWAYSAFVPKRMIFLWVCTLLCSLM